MEKRLKQYIDFLFSEAGNDSRANEIKEEIYSNTLDRYRDVLAQGKNENEAFNIAVSGIGDVSALIAASGAGPARGDAARSGRKKNPLVPAAVALYILCVVPVIIFGGIGRLGVLGVCLMFVMIAAGTFLIIYGRQGETTVPGESSEKKEIPTETREKIVETILDRPSVKAAWNAVVVLLYLLISFVSGAWHITWLIFIISMAIQKVIRAVMEAKQEE